MRHIFAKALTFVVVSHLVLGSPSPAADKVTCIILPIEYSLHTLPKKDEKKDAAEPKEIMSDADVIKGASALFEQRLDQTAKYEIETRDPAKLSAGGKFKAARFMIVSNLSILPSGGEADFALSINSRVVKTTSQEIVAVAGSSEAIAGPIEWPKTVSDFSSDAFKASATGKALNASMDAVIAKLKEQSAKISALKDD